MGKRFLLTARFARQTPTDADILPPRLAEAKTANRFAIRRDLWKMQIFVRVQGRRKF